MALKILQLRKQKELLQAQREELSELDGSFSLRSQELEKATEEAATQDDIDLVGEEISKFEAEQGEHEEKKKDLDKKISDIEQEMADLADTSPDNDNTPPPDERANNRDMEVRNRVKFDTMEAPVRTRRTQHNPLGLTRNEQTELYARQDVKDFLERVLSLANESAGQKRAVNNSEIGIPIVVMGFIRDSIEDYSLLLSRVTSRRIRGDGRAIFAGQIPEAVWTECCARINELDIDFSDMYLYCHKVAGYIPVCNATLEDFGGQDGIPTLGNEIIYNLLKAIGLALDKAIVYGDGIHMPLGFVRSLVLDKNPINPDDRNWSGTLDDNVGEITGEGVDFFRNIMIAAAAVDNHTSNSDITWIMNKKTWLKYIAPESLTFNAAGTLVAAQNNSFPILGGSIVFLSFVPEGDVVGGYLDNYLLAERAGISLAMSEHYFFLDEHTVYKASARYDGSPIVPFRDSFFAFNVNGNPPATTATFPPDTANPSNLLPPGGAGEGENDRYPIA